NLRDHLQEIVREHPTATHCVVGHSHGGAVSLQALRDLDVGLEMFRVVCISTPFVRVTNTSDTWQTTFSMGLYLLAAAAIVAVSPWIGGLRPAVIHPALFAVLLEFLSIAAFILSMRGIDSALSAWKNWSYSVQALSRHPQLRLDQ